MDSELKDSGGAGEPQLPSSLQKHRLHALLTSMACFLGGGFAGMFLESPLLFLVLALIGCIGGFVGFMLLVKPRCPDPKCRGRMDFKGLPNQGAYLCRLCGRSETFHYQEGD